MSKNKELLINDSDHQRTYSIFLSQEDYDRALSDNEFTKSLLYQARIAAGAQTISNSNPSCSGLNNPYLHVTETDYDSFSENIPPLSQNLSHKINIVWSYEQTTCLINSMATYYKDFNDPKRRKFIFEYVANDLISAGFTVDTKNVQSKWKGLLRSYTKAKDIKNRTGQGPSRFLFYDIMDEILGNQPKNNCHHSINSLDKANEGNSQPAALDTECAENNINIESVIEEEEIEVEIPTRPSEEPSTRHKRKRLSEKQIKLQYMDLKREEYAKRQKRHEERCAIEKERNEIDRGKLEVLQEYLRNKSR